MIRWVLTLVLICLALPAQAQDFPKLTGRVVDGANLLSPADEAELTGELQNLEQRSSRQLVVATVPSLGGYEIEDYGYRLGRAWGIGQKEADNGAILLVAPNERKVRVEVGSGLEPILTDALSNRVIDEVIIPRFKAGDYPGGIKAGVDSLMTQLQAPPEVAERAALEAAQARAQRGSQRSNGGPGLGAILFWGLIILFVILPLVRGLGGGRKYRGRRRRGWGGPVIIWGPGFGGGGGGFGGGSFGGGGGFGGFSGGGGGFGGGGASGSW
ncbi:MAG: Beta-propeller domains of methanol dehydrogenase type [uncultured Sphingomonas sp.]|uniref:Beta-propeller domains of methanol dehydrogenase type n=1 Tax=uncultured Sphingomonas sp. TaxID=158754 RepID=A0A6J4T012_9SPHN|nr:TPM domain-containing protein [uncultured Sphingomonas sp.]CAA9509907.1 MAG: Beta-propeller domains of methanol dehydrogenase type [uncultured Sphingomonas sp.]